MKATQHGVPRYVPPSARVFVVIVQPDGDRAIAEVADATMKLDAIYSDGVGAGGPWWHEAPIRLERTDVTLTGHLLETQAYRGDVPEQKRGLPRPLPSIEP